MPRTSLELVYAGILRGQPWFQGATLTGVLVTVTGMCTLHVVQPSDEQESLSSLKVKEC